ncbi:MAG: TetR/AcrR family transcriptional regulator C-terminal domain-containing protein [Mycobacteriales bacterium]
MPLRKADVLQGAMELLNDVGLDGLTARRLANKLGVQVGALYWHYSSKSALLDGVAEQIINEMLVEPSGEGDWADRLQEMAIRGRQSMLAHRDGARLVASFTAPPPSAVSYMRLLINVLRSAGASEEDAAIGADAITSFINGYTLEEQARKLDNVPVAQRDAAFRAELNIIISGIRVELLEQ